MVEPLSDVTYDINRCPAFVDIDDEMVVCAAPLVLQINKTLMGDDYGAWCVYDVSFACGHSLLDMETGVRNAEYV